MTCPCCWRCWPLLAAGAAAEGHGLSGGAGAGRSLRPVSGVLPMALELPPAVCGRSMSPPRTLPKPLRPAEAKCRSTLQQRPVRSWTHCGASSPFLPRSGSLRPADAWSHVPISLTSAASRWPAGRWSSRLRADTTSCSSCSRHRQIHAGPPPARHPAAPDPGRSRGDDENLLHRRADARQAGAS